MKIQIKPSRLERSFLSSFLLKGGPILSFLRNISCDGNQAPEEILKKFIIFWNLSLDESYKLDSYKKCVPTSAVPASGRVEAALAARF